MLKVTTKRLNKFHRAIEEIIFPELPRLSSRTDATNTPEFIQRLLELVSLRLVQIFDADDLAPELDVIAKRVSAKNKRELQRVIGVSARFADASVGSLLDSFRAANVARIKSIPGQLLVEVTEILSAAEAPNLRVEVIRDQIVERFNVSKSRAAVIARDQTITLNAQIAKQRQENLGIRQYIWTTSGDNRVRDDHSERDGEVFDWSNPPFDGHPGDAIQCRCTAFPVLPELA